MRRLRYVLRRLAWHLTLMAAPVLPLCAIARKPAAGLAFMADPHDEDRESSSALMDTIVAEWKNWDLGPLPDRLSWLLLTSGPRSINKVVGLLFAGQEDEPRLVVKMPRVPQASRTLRREAANLRAMHAACADGVAGMPRVLFCKEHDGLTMLGQTALKGTLIVNMLRPENYRDLASAVTRWLVDFAGQAQPSPPASWWHRLVEPVLADVSQFMGSVVDPAMLGETEEVLATLGPLPLVREHRDFGPYNVLIDGLERIAVLDWENAELQGLPALDLIYFLAYFALFLDGAQHPPRVRESFRATLNPGTLTGSVQRECLDYYMSRMRLDPSSLRPLRLFTWLVHCRWLCRHLAEDGSGTPDADTLRRSTPVLLWGEELRMQRSSRH